MWLLLLTLACGAHAPTPPGGTHGVAVEPLALPAFSVVNQRGEPRGPGDLVGHPTVVWFYPKAATAG